MIEGPKQKKARKAKEAKGTFTIPFRLVISGSLEVQAVDQNAAEGVVLNTSFVDLVQLADIGDEELELV